MLIKLINQYFYILLLIWKHSHRSVLNISFNFLSIIRLRSYFILHPLRPTLFSVPQHHKIISLIFHLWSLLHCYLFYSLLFSSPSLFDPRHSLSINTKRFFLWFFTLHCCLFLFPSPLINLRQSLYLNTKSFFFYFSWSPHSISYYFTFIVPIPFVYIVLPTSHFQHFFFLLLCVNFICIHFFWFHRDLHSFLSRFVA